MIPPRQTLHATPAVHFVKSDPMAAWLTLTRLCSVALGLRPPSVVQSDEVANCASLLPALSARHRIGGLVRHALDLLGFRHPLPSCLQALDAQCRAIRAAQTAHRLLLLRLSRSMADLPWVLLKGLGSAHVYYATPVLRLVNDVDVLVPWARVDDALARVLALGFQPDLPRGRTLDRAKARDHHIAVSRGPARVELHWDLVNWRTGVDLSPTARLAEQVLEQATDADIGGLAVRVPSVGHALLYACLHLFLHGRRRHLQSLCDVAVMRAYHMGERDWEQLRAAVLENPRRSVLGTAVDTCLTAATALLTAPPSEAELGALPRSPTIACLTRWRARSDGFGDFHGDRSPFDPPAVDSLLDTCLRPWLALGCTPACLRALARTLLPPATAGCENHGGCPIAQWRHLSHLVRVARRLLRG